MKKAGPITAILCAGLMLSACGQSAVVSSQSQSEVPANQPLQSTITSTQRASDEAGNEEHILQGKLLELTWNGDVPLVAGKIVGQQMHGDFFYLQVAKTKGSTLYLFDIKSGELYTRLETPANCRFQIVKDQIYLLEHDYLRTYDHNFNVVSEKALDPSLWQDSTTLPTLSANAQTILFVGKEGLPTAYDVDTGSAVIWDRIGKQGALFTACNEISPDLVFLVETSDAGVSYLLYDRKTKKVESVSADYIAEKEGLFWAADTENLFIPKEFSSDGTFDGIPLLLQSDLSNDREIRFVNKNNRERHYIVPTAFENGKDVDVLKIVSNRAVLFSYYDESGAEHLALYVMEK